MEVSDNGNNSAPKSWSESLQQYQSSKSNLQYEQPNVFRYTRDKSTIWRNEQAEVNPVLQRSTNPAKDAMLESRFQPRIPKTKPPARDEGIDIITLQPKKNYSSNNDTQAAQSSSLASTQRSTGSQSGHNLSYQKKYQRANDQCQEDLDSLFGSKKRLSDMRERTEFNILTHVYKEAPERGNVEDQEKFEKIQSQAKEYKKQHFDPIQQKFLDRDSDVKLENTLTGKERARKDLHDKRLPVHFKTKESNAYDIVTCTVRDEDRAEAIEQQKNKPLMKHFYKNYYENELMEHRNKQSEIDEQRRANTFASKPLIEFQHQGRLYDTITNKPYLGADSVPTPAFLALKNKEDHQPKVIWDHIKDLQQTSVLMDEPSPPALSRTMQTSHQLGQTLPTVPDTFAFSSSLKRFEKDKKKVAPKVTNVTVHDSSLLQSTFKTSAPKVKPIVRSSGFQNVNIFKKTL